MPITMTKREEQAFNEWLDESQYAYYDSDETFIHMPTRKLFSFAQVFEKFLKEPVDFETKMFSDLAKAISA